MSCIQIRPQLLFLLAIAACVVALVFIIKQLIGAEKISEDTLICFTGTMGSGKTYLAVSTALKEYSKLRASYRRATHPLWGWFFRLLYPGSELEPHLFSNIPILIRRNLFNRKKDVYSEVLTGEHLIMRRHIPPRSVVVIDEVSITMNQYEFNNPLIMENVSMLMRFSRQWEISKLILTDQSLSIVKPVRERIAVAYMLTDFHRYMALPFFKVTVVPLLMVADNAANTVQSFDKYFFGVLPYKWWQRIFRSRRYDTKCYSPIYREGWQTDPPARYDSLKTRYVIDITAEPEDEAFYKLKKKKYRDRMMTGLGGKADTTEDKEGT